MTAPDWDEGPDIEWPKAPPPPPQWDEPPPNRKGARRWRPEPPIEPEPFCEVEVPRRRADVGEGAVIEFPRVAGTPMGGEGEANPAVARERQAAAGAEFGRGQGGKVQAPVPEPIERPEPPRQSRDEVAAAFGDGGDR